MNRRTRLLVLAGALVALAGPAPAHGAPVPEGATYEEAYFPSVDGTMLHADVLRPKNVPAGAKVPTILTVSPYTGHTYEAPGGVPDPNVTGPSGRFFDFVEAAKLFERGYAYVIVDLRGHGGSGGGCNDWGGNGEQGDVKAAVEWVAGRDWSNGKVGMYGKSYDAWTGLMGVIQEPKGLAAVVAQEPVYDGYKYLYMNRVAFLNRFATGALFQAGSQVPAGGPGDNPEYHLNSLGVPACVATNYAQQQIDDPAFAYWQERALIPKAKGKTTPVFLMQGFLEDNTKPDGAFEFFNSLAGPKRGWFGQWDHVRGTDKNPGNDKKFATGRATFVEEVMRFYEHHLNGGPTPKDPPVIVQSGDGRFRAEQAWPPRDSVNAALNLRPGAYVDSDDGANNGSAEAGPPNGVGSWTVTQPFKTDAVLAGTPRIEAEVDAPAGVNFVADVYVIDRKNNATLVSRGATLTPGGDVPVRFELYGNDWPVLAGQRIGVLITAANDEWWVHVRSQTAVSVLGGTLQLPFLRYRRTKFEPGDKAVKLSAWESEAPFEIGGDIITAAEVPFSVPALKPLPSIRLKTSVRGRTISVKGTAPRGTRVTLSLLKGSKRVARKRVSARSGRFSTRFRVRSAGKYTVSAAGTAAGDKLSSRKRVRVR